MEINNNFFDLVLPKVGHVCVMGLRSDKSMPPKTQFFREIGDAQDFIEALLAEQREVYFACATFEDPSRGRIAKNTKAHQCLYIDIDCGINKPYKTQKEGLQALSAFIKARDLPMPSIVDSGNGFHAYWALDKTLDYNAWSYLASGLYATCELENFYVDSSVTTDGARILRIPGTLNFKNQQDPKNVRVVRMGEPVDSEGLKLKLEYAGPDLKKLSNKAEFDAVTLALINRKEASFEKILKKCDETVEVEEIIEQTTKSKDGTETTKQKKVKVVRNAGCAQIDYLNKNQDITGEELWRNGLSIAVFCSDGDKYIHEISKAHPDYDPGETYQKAARIPAPHTCKQFQKNSPKPEMCVTCPHKGKIKTPIVLGHNIVAAQPIDNIIDDVWHEGLKEAISIDIPIVYPRPWYRPQKGGVAIRGNPSDEVADQEDDDTADDTLVYDNDIWIQKLLRDPIRGYMAQVARILPKDGLLEFTVPLNELTSKDKCRDVLSMKGVVLPTEKRMNLMRQYIAAWVDMLQKANKSQEAMLQMGWASNDTRFIIGNKDINSDGTVSFSPSSSTTEDIAPMYSSKGNLSAWKKVVNHYNIPGNEARAFALFCSFGAPLIKYFNVGSMMVHLTNSASGVGKSTAQMAANSVWGHPKDTMLTEHDTNLAKHQRFGVLNNIIVTIDEITNIDPEEASDIVYRFSNNRGRNRLHANANAERKNTTTWQTIAITSGNNSLYDTLIAHKAASEGELKRVLEIEIQKDFSISKEESDELFHHILMDNFGLAGEEYMKYVVPNWETIKPLLKKTKNEFDKAAGFDAGDRFHSFLCAAVFTGARIAKQLGLHDIDVDRIWDWAVKLLSKTKSSLADKSIIRPEEAIGRFLLEYTQSTLVINSVGVGGLPSAPIKMPHRDLAVRYEPDTGTIYIASQTLQTWCSAKRITFAPLKFMLASKGVLKDISKFNLAAGTSLPGIKTHVVAIDQPAIGVEFSVDTLSKTE